MSADELVRVGGLLRCCVKTIQERKQPARVGEVITCSNLKCNAQIEYRTVRDIDDPEKEVEAWHWKPR